MSNIKITWYGHACFVLECDGFRLAIDPYDPTTPGYKPLSITANRVLCSHHHHDHCYLEAVCMPLNEVRCPFTVEKIKTYHDGEEGALRGENTIHIISAEGYRIAHFGDLGHMLDAQQIKSLGKLDLALVPVGGTYTIDPRTADELCRALDVKTVVPMHYRTNSFGYDNIAHLDEFLALRRDVCMLSGSSFLLSDKTPSATLVPRYL